MNYILTLTIALLFCHSIKAQETANTTEKIDVSENYNSVSDTVKKKKGVTLKEVVVTANNQKKPITALRSGLKPLDVPQSIQIIGSEIIEQQQSIRLSDVIKNANGVYVGSARGGAQESFWSRGYDMSANNLFKNGFRFNSGSIPEVSSLEKVEILKGNAALLYGNVAPGGILNMVTKSPLFKKGGEIVMQTGSYSIYKPSIDIYGPLNETIAYRFTGSYENSESFRNFVKRERYYVNPSFLFKANKKTEILLQADYLNDDWTPDFGTGAIGKEIASIPRNTYLGATWAYGNTKQSSVSALLKHDFNKLWKLNFNTSFQNYDRQSKGTERVQPSDEANETTYGDWNRPLGQNKNLEQIFGEQLSLQGSFHTGTLKHELFTGFDFENSYAQAYTYVFNEKAVMINGKYVVNLYDTVNIFNFDSNSQRNDIPNANNTKIVKTDTNRFGVYIQDLISIAEKFKILAGLRWSWQEAQAETSDFINNTITKDKKRLDEAFTPKLGLVYQPTKEMSLFTSYSNSFTPNTGVTIYGETIAPSIIYQYEVGVKKDFWKGILSTNVTLYQIVNSNLAQTAEFKADGTNNTDANVKVLTGETKSKGIEIDITAKPTDAFNIIAGYSYNDMRYTKTSGLNGSFIQGDRLVRTPANTANLSFFYTLQSGNLKGVSIGAIGNYIGKRTGGWNNQYDSTKPNGIWDREIPLEGYTTIDLSAGYSWGKFSILCKLSNITNELNYTVHENYSINPIAPRQVLTSLKYKF